MGKSVWARIFERELWNYDTVSTETLLSICRITRWIAIPCFWSAGLMAVCLFEIFILSKFHPDGSFAIGKITVILCAVSGLICCMLFIPSIIGLAIVHDINPVLAKRGVRIPKKRSLDEKINESLIKMVLFIALPVTLFAAIEEPTLINWLVVLVYVMVALTAMIRRPTREKRSARAKAYQHGDG